MSDPELLAVLERYYDTVPRATADAEPVGPFTLFVAREGWPYYARPTLGSKAAFTAHDVRSVLTRQRELDLPRHLEWVHEVTPTLLPAARGVGLPVAECALMVLGDDAAAAVLDGVSVRLLDPDEDDFDRARAAVDAGFKERDMLTGEGVANSIAAAVRRRLMRVAGAFDGDGRAIGGGSHAPRAT